MKEHYFPFTTSFLQRKTFSILQLSLITVWKRKRFEPYFFGERNSTNILIWIEVLKWIRQQTDRWLWEQQSQECHAIHDKSTNISHAIMIFELCSQPHRAPQAVLRVFVRGRALYICTINLNLNTWRERALIDTNTNHLNLVHISLYSVLLRSNQ